MGKCWTDFAGIRSGFQNYWADNEIKPRDSSSATTRRIASVCMQFKDVIHTVYPTSSLAHAHVGFTLDTTGEQKEKALVHNKIALLLFVT